MPTEKGRKQVPAPSCSFSLSGGHIGRAFPEIFNPRSSRNQLFGTDLSLVPGQGFGGPVGPGLPLKVLDHGEIWESQVRGLGNWDMGLHTGGLGQQLFPNWHGRVLMS